MKWNTPLASLSIIVIFVQATGCAQDSLVQVLHEDADVEPNHLNDQEVVRELSFCKKFCNRALSCSDDGSVSAQQCAARCESQTGVYPEFLEYYTECMDGVSCDDTSTAEDCSRAAVSYAPWTNLETASLSYWCSLDEAHANYCGFAGPIEPYEACARKYAYLSGKALHDMGQCQAADSSCDLQIRAQCLMSVIPAQSFSWWILERIPPASTCYLSVCQ